MQVLNVKWWIFCQLQTSTLTRAGGCFNTNTTPYSFRNSQYKDDKTVAQPTYLYKGNPFPWKTGLLQNQDLGRVEGLMTCAPERILMINIDTQAGLRKKSNISQSAGNITSTWCHLWQWNLHNKYLSIVHSRPLLNITNTSNYSSMS